MTRNTLARIVEAVFSWWPLLVIPIAVSMMVGVGQAAQVRAQYASADFRAALERHGLRPTMSRTGNCYDNAAKESFFHMILPRFCGHGVR